MKKNRTIVVFGGTGYYGREVVKRLVERKESIRVVSRDLTLARSVVGLMPQIIQGDVRDKDIVRMAMLNAKAVIICLSAGKPKLIRRMKEIERDSVIQIMDEAARNKIERLVYMSGYDLKPDILKKLNILDFGQTKIEIESRIRKSGFNWTILGDAPSFELFFSLLKKNRLIIPGGGEKPFPSISADDVGEITAQAVLRNDLSGRRLRLTGPEALTFPEIADRIKEITGKNIRCVAPPLGLINIVSYITKPVYPFIRYIYKSLKLLNNFPEEISREVARDHQVLRELFDYQPVSIEDEIRQRLGTL